MNILKIFLIFFITSFFLTNCAKKEKVSLIVEEDVELQMIRAFREGYREFELGDALFAAKKFNEAELLFPQSSWAPKAALMAAYVYYAQDYYGDSIAELERFMKVYPKHKNLDYVYYLLAICFYEQIVDEKKDLESIIKAKKYFNFVIKNYPNTEYAIDSEFKIDLIKFSYL